MSRSSKNIVKLLGITLIALLSVVLFPALRTLLLGTYIALDATGQMILDLIGIGLIAFIFAGLLAPMEALGWWAGWYGDRINTIIDPGTLEQVTPTDDKVSRYVVYLDGIAQTKYQYMPAVETFLSQLAAALPDDIAIVRGIMPYSVLNRPLTEDRFFSFFWRLADRAQSTGAGGIFGRLLTIVILLRNIQVVAVSADQRYGPIYNHGTAQVIYNGLIGHGYQPGSGVPVTLLGYSGGGQISSAAAPILKEVLNAPIDVISISGVFSGNNNVLQLEHLYHFVGDQDPVERLGSILFPKRWKPLLLSYWNRAKRHGKVTITSLGPVGHTHAKGPFGNILLPDRRTHVQQTVELVAGILKGDSPIFKATLQKKAGNYEVFQQAAFNHPSYYPLKQSVDLNLYRPIAPWMGRLILPSKEQRQQVKGVLFEVHHAPPAYQHLVGQIVNLRWSDEPQVQAFVRSVTKDVHFSEEAEYRQSQGGIYPDRINHWQQVDPLESLAGARPNDDIIVMLRAPVVATDAVMNVIDRDYPSATSATKSVTTLLISHEPVQITGRFYGLVKILQPVENEITQFQVIHFNCTSRQFDGVEEVICIPQVVEDTKGIFFSTTKDIEKSPANEAGWYIYGAKDSTGIFVVQSMAPRALLRLQPDDVIVGKAATVNYIKRQAWDDAVKHKGTTKSVLLSLRGGEIQKALQQWQEGDAALLIHVYGGIGGKKGEPAAKGPVYFGHFAYGVARIVREPLADELSFDIEYCQVYTQNSDGLIAGRMAWNRYMGDRQFGWLGTRPVVDILVKWDAFTADYDFQSVKRSALESLLEEQLKPMMARYRIGDGTGGTYVEPAHNCSQDSNQAFYGAIKQIQDAVNSNPELKHWARHNPEQEQRFKQMGKLCKDMKRELLPFGTARADWKHSANTLGISPEQDTFKWLRIGIGSWRTMLPRLASKTIAKQFLQEGASIWVLRTSQVGGYDPDIEPVAPTPIGV